MSMKICLLMFGRTRNAEIRVLLDDYLRRITRYADVKVTELRDASESSLRKLKLTPHSHAVLLDPSGKQFDSAEFASWLGKLRDHGIREIVFLCGPAEGLSAGLEPKPCTKLSLSRLTMPHELARLALTEQIYRAFTILTGHPYPK